MRIAHRGGGAEGGDWMTVTSWEATNCSKMCTSLLGYNRLSTCCAEAVPFHIKCFEAESLWPMNGRRFQFASQIATASTDPALPELIPVTNITACMRMEKFEFESIRSNQILIP